jgi:hypothetical protein
MAASPHTRSGAALLALCATLTVLSANGQMTAATFKCTDTNNAAQCALLADFYYATNGPTSWFANATTGWAAAAAGTKTNYCTFVGVGCSSSTSGNVTRMCVHAPRCVRVRLPRRASACTRAQRKGADASPLLGLTSRRRPARTQWHAAAGPLWRDSKLHRLSDDADIPGAPFTCRGSVWDNNASILTQDALARCCGTDGGR